MMRRVWAARRTISPRNHAQRTTIPSFSFIIGVSVIFAFIIVLEGSIFLFRNSTSFSSPTSTTLPKKIKLLNGGEPHSVSDGLCVLFFVDSSVLASPQTFDEFRYFWLFDASKQLPELNLFAWGPGFEGYNTSITLRDNLLLRFNSVRVDSIVVFKNLLSSSNYLAMVRHLSSETTIILPLGDCLNLECADDIQNSGASIVLMSKASEISKYSKLSHRRLFIHIPDCVPKDIFYFNSTSRSSNSNSSSSIRDNNNRTFGSIAILWSDLKNELNVKQFIKRFQLLFKNNNYNNNNNNNSLTLLRDPRLILNRNHQHRKRLKEEQQSEEQQNFTAAEFQMIQFANELKNYDIVFVDEKRRIPEIVMSGSLAILLVRKEEEYENENLIDVQDEEGQWNENIVQLLDKEMTNEEFIGFINWWRVHVEYRKQSISKANRIANEYFDCNRTTNLFLSAIKRFISGQRGFWFPYPHFLSPEKQQQSTTN